MHDDRTPHGGTKTLPSLKANYNDIRLDTLCLQNPEDFAEDWFYRFSPSSRWTGRFDTEAGCYADALLKILSVDGPRL